MMKYFAFILLSLICLNGCVNSNTIDIDKIKLYYYALNYDYGYVLDSNGKIQMSSNYEIKIRRIDTINRDTIEYYLCFFDTADSLKCLNRVPKYLFEEIYGITLVKGKYIIPNYDFTPTIYTDSSLSYIKLYVDSIYNNFVKNVNIYGMKNEWLKQQIINERRKNNSM